MLRKLPVVFFVAGLLSFLACEGPPSSTFNVRLRWAGLDEAQGPLPRSVQVLLLLVYVEGSTSPENSLHTVSSLKDSDGNGRLELVRDALPTEKPFRLVLLAGPSEGDWTHIGLSGPIVLDRGERRYIDIQMYNLRAATSLMSGPSARALHTLTALKDGRVLVAGGFDRVQAVDCPGEAPPSAQCYEFTATSSAFIFDPATGRFRQTKNGMLLPRGGHTASLLPSGRVLIAGGAERLILAVVNQGGGYHELSWIRGADDRAPRTFEVFDPELNPEEEDLERDGDPWRGGFRGPSGATPGMLDEPRILHGASVLSDGRVLLAGGLASPQSFTLMRSSAQSESLVGGGMLQVPRPLANTAVIGRGNMERVFIAGGATARNDAELAEIWVEGGGAGMTTSAMIMTATGAPQWNCYRPRVETVGAGGGVLVVGWYGPWCMRGMSTPLFDPPANAVRCRFAPNRAYTFDASTNRAVGTAAMKGHAFGASTRLDDGTIVVSGGFSDLTLAAENAVVFYGSNLVGGAVQVIPLNAAMEQGRALHAIAPLFEGGVLVVGGLRFSGGMPSLISAPEVLFIDRPRG
ncbi:MAG: hypothetical protein NZM37_02120 [Sandaracinaceae bacterium]|nr:hypothetical protein [Sandaracinaceae bacterium]